MKICGERAVDSRLLYYALCDEIGNDLQLKPQADAFYHFNKTYLIVEVLAKDSDPKMDFFKRKRHKDKKKQRSITVASVAPQVIAKTAQKVALPQQPKPSKPPKIPKRLQNPAASVVLIEQSQGLAPYIKYLKTIAPYALVNSIYKALPDDAVVYVSDTGTHIHVSPQCVSLNCAPTVYQGTYEQARYKDFFRMYGFYDQRLASYHIPPLCQNCGRFKPILASGNSKIIYKEL